MVHRDGSVELRVKVETKECNDESFCYRLNEYHLQQFSYDHGLRGHGFCKEQNVGGNGGPPMTIIQVFITVTKLVRIAFPSFK